MMTPALPMRITVQERQSPLWLKLQEHYAQRLRSLDQQNRGHLDPIQTQYVRGRIAEVEALLNLSQDLPGMQQP